MMAGSSLRRVTMDDYNTEVLPGNQLDKASHIERGPIFPTATHCFTAGLPNFVTSQLNHSFPPWQGGVSRLPAARHITSHIGEMSQLTLIISPPLCPYH